MLTVSSHFIYMHSILILHFDVRWLTKQFDYAKLLSPRLLKNANVIWMHIRMQ